MGLVMESLENYYLKYSYLSTSSLIKYYKSIKDIDPFQEEIFKQYSQKELLQFLINPLYDFYSITINELEKYLTNHPQFSNSNNLIPYRIEKTPFSLLIYFYNYLLFHDILKDFQPLLIDNIYNEFKIYKKFPIIKFPLFKHASMNTVTHCKKNIIFFISFIIFKCFKGNI